jgi:hypothetical protein
MKMLASGRICGCALSVVGYLRVRRTVAYGVRFPITHYIGIRCVFHNILFYIHFINFLLISLIISPSPFAHFIIQIREKWREVIYSHYHMKNNHPENKP